MTDPAPTNITPISADSKLSDQEKRDQLRARIEAGEKRLEDRSITDHARDAAASALCGPQTPHRLGDRKNIFRK